MLILVDETCSGERRHRRRLTLDSPVTNTPSDE